MENTALHVLGPAKEVHDVENEKTAFLRDPFSATLNDFVVYCLNELAEALHLAIVHTYTQLPKKKRVHFYLVGYKERTSWGNIQQKIYDDPSQCDQGLQIKWLLKNLRWYWMKYAEYMELSDDAFDDITGFILFDVVQRAYADIGTELRESEDENLVRDCYQASLDLVIAIAEAAYYQEIAADILKFKDNLESMLPLIDEFETYQRKQRDVRNELLDTNKVIEFIKSDILMKELEREAKEVNNPAHKPLTNYFLCTVMPRFQNLTLLNDNGFAGQHQFEAVSAIPEPFVPLVCETEAPVIIPACDTETPVIIPAIAAIESEPELIDSVVSSNSDDDYVIEASIVADDTPKAIAQDPLMNTTLDGSLIVVSTPNNKVLNRLKKDAAIASISEAAEDEEKPPVASTEQLNKSDVCDGSFVLI